LEGKIMNYYVIQVITREEEKYIKLAENALRQNQEIPPGTGRLVWPRRQLNIRRRGKQKMELAPLFPGYLFWEGDTIFPDLYWTLRRVPGFLRFLKSNQDIEALSGEPLRLIRHFLNFGEVVHPSRVYFDENNRIRVTQGPLKGMEGLIVKIDRRKQRAKVRLNLYEDSFLVDFGFELIEPAGEGDETVKG
jgi:transcriptional antiterminator NusG